jgi:hypothetical protein
VSASLRIRWRPSSPAPTPLTSKTTRADFRGGSQGTKGVLGRPNRRVGLGSPVAPGEFKEI